MSSNQPRVPGVLVAGSINMDIVATAASIPFPGQTLSGGDLQYYPGGKGANQAIAAARAGVLTRMVGCVGSDGFGTQLTSYLAESGIDTTPIDTWSGASGVALIVVADSGENSIVVIPGANGEVHAGQFVDDVFDNIAVGVAQFEVPIATVEAFFSACRARDVLTVLNTAPAVADPGRALQLADVVILNETELGTYAGQAVSEDVAVEDVIELAKQVQRDEAQAIVVTLGRRGCIALSGPEVISVPAVVVEAVDTTGAGDCFVGYLAAGMSQKLSLDAALTRANQAAALSVQKRGAGPSMPALTDVEGAFG